MCRGEHLSSVFVASLGNHGGKEKGAFGSEKMQKTESGLGRGVREFEEEKEGEWQWRHNGKAKLSQERKKEKRRRGREKRWSLRKPK